MPSQLKFDVVNEIKDTLNAAEGGVLLIDFRGLTVIEMATLRRELHEVGGDLRVYKNRLVQIALRENAQPAMDDLLLGPSAFVFIAEEPVASAKILAKFAKDHPALEMKGGLVQNEVIDTDQIKALSKLPSREELIAKLLGTLTNPARGMVTVLGGVSRGLVTALDGVAKGKEGEPGPAPEPEPTPEPDPEPTEELEPETETEEDVEAA
ncbi:MAG: 50S ribosomal protein L10 [Actinomycetia bacterium]|nr:50S ribosomal protein L10 [Actinomycetes bacterium]